MPETSPKTIQSALLNGTHILRKRLVISALLGGSVFVALLIVGDVNQLAKHLAQFFWPFAVPVISLTLLNFLARFVKWHYYLHVVGDGAEKITLRASLVIFCTGLAMTITPGKIGEFLKIFFVKQVTGVALTQTAPVLIAERVTDALAMLLLASMGFLIIDNPVIRVLLLGIGLAAVILVGVIQWRTLTLALIAVCQKVPLLGRRTTQMHTLYESTYRLFQPRVMVWSGLISLGGWLCETIAFGLVLIGLGVPATLQIFVLAGFALNTSVLIGSLLLLPGGLGATDFTLASLLAALLPAMSKDVNIASTLLIRLATLWLAVILGLTVFGVFRHILTPAHGSQAIAPTATGSAESAGIPAHHLNGQAALPEERYASH